MMTLEHWMEMYNAEKKRADSLEMDLIAMAHKIRNLETEINLYRHREVIDGVVDALLVGQPKEPNR